jgi:hypothetical protein
MIFTHHRVFVGCSGKEHKVRGTYGKHERQQKYLKRFWWGNLKESGH